MIETPEKRSNQAFTLKAGTLYPLLHNLEQKNLIESYEKPAENGKPRKYYSITKDGQKFLTEKKQEWKLFSSAVNQVIGGMLYGLS